MICTSWVLIKNVLSMLRLSIMNIKNSFSIFNLLKLKHFPKLLFWTYFQFLKMCLYTCGLKNQRYDNNERTMWRIRKWSMNMNSLKIRMSAMHGILIRFRVFLAVLVPEGLMLNWPSATNSTPWRRFYWSIFGSNNCFGARNDV